jgi:hypothetical protein
MDCGIEIQVGSISPTKCASLGYFDVSIQVANKQESHHHQKVKGAGDLMAKEDNVDVFEGSSGTTGNQLIRAEISERNKYIRLCCFCFQRRSASGNCRIDCCHPCDLRRKNEMSFSRTSTAAPADAGIYTNGVPLTIRSMSISSGSRPSTMPSADGYEHCATLGFFKAYKKNIFRSKSVQYIRLCCNCYNDRPGMQIDPCSDCKERRLNSSYPKKFSMPGTVCSDCGLAIKQG